MEEIGFLFSTEAPKCTENIPIRNFNINLRTIGENPGHVQSGQYLWPAAKALAEFLVDNWESFESSIVIELGSGCGLTGIACAIMNSAESTLFLTDYDYGSLLLLEENLKLNFGEFDQENRKFIEIVSLQWGAIPLPTAIHSRIYSFEERILTIGSDLLYDISVVHPLFITVKEILNPNSLFILMSSFDYGQDIRDQIKISCQQLKLESEIVQQLNLELNQFHLEIFRLSSCN